MFKLLKQVILAKKGKKINACKIKLYKLRFKNHLEVINLVGLHILTGGY